MNVLLVNASPKINGSSSQIILDRIRAAIPEPIQICQIDIRKPTLDTQQRQALAQADAIVFAFGLYVDGIPSHLLHCMEQIQAMFAKSPVICFVYAIVNCGFYDAQQGLLSLNMMRHWCTRCNLIWGQGLSFGGGGMASMLDYATKRGPMRRVGQALDKLARNAYKKQQAPDALITPAIARFVYQYAAQMSWRKQIKQNGGTTKDLFLKK